MIPLPAALSNVLIAVNAAALASSALPALITFSALVILPLHSERIPLLRIVRLASVRNCLIDEGRPLGTGLQEQGPNRLRRLSLLRRLRNNSTEVYLRAGDISCVR